MTIGLDAVGNAGSGFGASSNAEINSLAKALEAGYAVGSDRTGGSALRVESLESSLKVLTFSASHVKFWKKLPKSPAYSTVEEYNQLSDYGGRGGVFTREGELPQATDTSYARRTKLVKFLGTVREVTHQASLVHPAHGDLIALENQSGILFLMEQIEKSLFSGDSTLAFDGEAEQWDGLDAMIDPTSVLDLEGDSLQEADIEEASNIIIENFGFPTDCFLGTRVNSDLAKSLYPRQRVMMPAPSNGVTGITVRAIETNGGVVELNPDVFIRKAPTPPGAATSTSAPGAITSVAAATTTDGLADFTKGAPAGQNYRYAVTAANRFGESAPVFSASLDNSANTDDTIALTITNAASIGAFAPEYFNVYRTVGNAAAVTSTDVADYSLVARVPASSQSASGVTTTNDANLTLPFTSVVYLGELTPSVITFRQLMPMMKMDLAVLSPAYRWMILLYGTPILFAPKKWIRLINVGDLSTR